MNPEPRRVNEPQRVTILEPDYNNKYASPPRMMQGEGIITGRPGRETQLASKLSGHHPTRSSSITTSCPGPGQADPGTRPTPILQQIKI